MLNIQINGEKVIIFEQTKLTDLHAADAYAMLIGDTVSLRIGNSQTDPYFNDINAIEAKNNLYVAGVIVTDTLGNMEVLTNNIIFDKLIWDKDAWEYSGVFLENANFDELNSKAGIKVFFGEH